MLILGIDPGTRILGYSLLNTDGGQLQLVAMDVLYLRNIPDFKGPHTTYLPLHSPYHRLFPPRPPGHRGALLRQKRTINA